LPEASAVVEPVPSSNAYAAARLDVDACRFKEAVAELPLINAVIVTAWFAVIVPTAAVKLAVVVPEPTDTEAGTVRMLLLLESVIVAPPVGAACDSVAVQVELPPELIVTGAHCNVVTVTVTVWVTVTAAVAELPLSDAVTVTA
jgi:hypothetical protein